MAHLPTVIEELREDERILEAFIVTKVVIHVFYEGGQRERYFILDDLAQTTNEQVIEEILEDLEEYLP